MGLNNAGTIINCHSATTVTGKTGLDELGGLVGYNRSSIRSCHSTGPVTAGDNSDIIGGLVGGNIGAISNCYSTGEVIVADSGSAIGGLAGMGGGTFTNCYSTGNISSGNRAHHMGGFIGSLSIGAISNCYSTGNISVKNNSNGIGGLVGITGGGSSINYCYSVGHVSAGNDSNNIGGLVGVTWPGDNSIIDNYFLNVAGPNNGYGTPLTKSQMKQQASFVGWDFVGETANGPNDIWTICEGVDYPKLTWQFDGKYPLVISRCIVRAGNTDYISIPGRMRQQMTSVMPTFPATLTLSRLPSVLMIWPLRFDLPHQWKDMEK